jgi:hypothetical protein
MLKVVGSFWSARANRVWIVLDLIVCVLLGVGLVAVGIWGPSVVQMSNWWIGVFGATYLVQGLAGTVLALASPPKTSDR